MADPEFRQVVESGTPMRKVIPPRLVSPYLTGQRNVLAGFVYRAQDVRFHDPAEAYHALGLGYAGSEFVPTMSEFYVIAWPARTADGYVPRTMTSGGIPEFSIEPIPIPVGATMLRVQAGPDELVASYDGLAWQQEGA